MPAVVGRPRYDEIALGVECKSHSVFVKSIVKETLGLRRELSRLSHKQVSTLAQAAPLKPPVQVRADPASEYWVAFFASNGQLYRDSPKAFGIKYKHWQP
jgi:hypothetical protein